MIELGTSRLQGGCSTTKLKWLTLNLGLEVCYKRLFNGKLVL